VPRGGKYGEKKIMEIRVLGCYGGELPGYFLGSFMLDGKLVVDAGAITSVLPTSW
jgi:hypothetical protein